QAVPGDRDRHVRGHRRARRDAAGVRPAGARPVARAHRPDRRDGHAAHSGLPRDDAARGPGRRETPRERDRRLSPARRRGRPENRRARRARRKLPAGGPAVDTPEPRGQPPVLLRDDEAPGTFDGRGPAARERCRWRVVREAHAGPAHRRTRRAAGSFSARRPESVVTSMPARPEHPDAPHVPPAESPAPATVAPPQPRRHRRIILAAGLAVIVALVAFGAWRLFFAAPSLPPGIIAVSGRIEGDDSAVSPKTSGRIRELTVREGDHV